MNDNRVNVTDANGKILYTNCIDDPAYDYLHWGDGYGTINRMLIMTEHWQIVPVAPKDESERFCRICIYANLSEGFLPYPAVSGKCLHHNIDIFYDGLAVWHECSKWQRFGYAHKATNTRTARKLEA